MKWNSIKEITPIEGIEVLVWDGNLNLENTPKYDLATYRNFNNGNHFISGPYSLQNITHWMSLPEPPKENMEHFICYF